MISDGAATVAQAIEAAMLDALPGAVVSVYSSEPETAAAPCVWLAFVAARYGPGWLVTFDATVTADAALGAVDAQRQLATMTDAILRMECAGVAAREITARGGGLTTRIGEVPHPCTVVSIPQTDQVC